MVEADADDSNRPGPEDDEDGPVLRGEENVAVRVRLEREARGWSTNAVSDRMNDAGYEMNPSAVWRIENGKRRVNVNEAIGLAEIFGISLENLVGPPKLAAHTRAMELIEEVRRKMRDSHKASLAFAQARDAFDNYLDNHPEIRDEAEAVIARILAEETANLPQPFEVRRYDPAPDTDTDSDDEADT